MAESDWDLVMDGALTWIGGDDGSQVIHANLANPLTGEGTHGRHFVAALSSQPPTRGMHLLKAATDPNLTGVPDTKSISVRAWVRAHQDSTGSQYRGGPIAQTDGTWNAQIPNGYFLQLGNWDDNLNQLLLTKKGVGGEVSTLITGALPSDTWYKLRLDVIPVLNGMIVDRTKLDIYTGVGVTGSEVWTLEHTETFLLTDPGAVPWGGASRNGVGIISQDNGIEAPTEIFIDRTQLFVETV